MGRGKQSIVCGFRPCLWPHPGWKCVSFCPVAGNSRWNNPRVRRLEEER